MHLTIGQIGASIQCTVDTSVSSEYGPEVAQGLGRRKSLTLESKMVNYGSYTSLSPE